LGDEPLPADATNPETAVTAANLAYVMVTSGSTGRPKGVEICHRSVIRLLFGVDDAALGPDTVIVQLVPATFDAATFEIWGALLHGGRLVLAPDGALRPAALADPVAQLALLAGGVPGTGVLGS
jgi:non-ribosomal peptide synthetase component F